MLRHLTIPLLLLSGATTATHLAAQTLVRDLTPANASSSGSAPSTPVAASGFALLALPFQSMPLVSSDAAGFARTPFPVPAGASFQGLQLFAQYAVFDPSGALLGGFSLSEGLWLRLGT